MKKHNNAIVKRLRAYATPMNKFNLIDWLDANLADTDISATVSPCVDGKGFVAHEIELSDGKGSNRRFTVPLLSDEFTFDGYGIGTTYSGMPPKARFKGNNMYILPHQSGYVLVSYKSMICFFHAEQNVVYFKRNAFACSATTSRHINEFLTHFVDANALKMFAKQAHNHHD